MRHSKRNIKVVIVEDNPYYNRLLTRYVDTICSGDFFREFQFKITSYLTAHDCIEEMEDDMDILVLDYFLFNKEEEDILSGVDVLKVAQKHAPQCKVIVVSALKSNSTIMKLKEEGIYAYVDKNVSSMNRIGSILQSILHEVKQERA